MCRHPLMPSLWCLALAQLPVHQQPALHDVQTVRDLDTNRQAHTTL